MDSSLLADSIFSAFSEPALYKSVNSGVPFSIDAILVRGFENNAALLLTGISEKIDVISVLADEVPDPRPGDTVTINDKSYKIDEELSNNGYIIKLSVK